MRIKLTLELPGLDKRIVKTCQTTVDDFWEDLFTQLTTFQQLRALPPRIILIEREGD